jgi:tripartite-type tricarboxylate transporter receptor subunit TctC
MFTINRRALLAGGMAAAAFPGVARAETWPAKPIRWIVPYTAGGLTDVVTRSRLRR